MKALAHDSDEVRPSASPTYAPHVIAYERIISTFASQGINVQTSGTLHVSETATAGVLAWTIDVIGLAGNHGSNICRSRVPPTPEIDCWPDGGQPRGKKMKKSDRCC